MDLAIALYIAGTFSIVLGIGHFFLPDMLDFKQAMPQNGLPLRPFRLLFYSYDTKRSDLRGIVWIMNHCASYTILSIGVWDILWRTWLGTSAGSGVAFWIAGWWFIRALSQLYLGKRRGDWLVMAWFSILGLVHVIAATQKGVTP